ncbi:MAG: DUF6597 domain-containing transcriptional factor [Duganella sp.]
MYYREYPPHPALAAHVACLWTACVPAVAPGRAHVHRVLPDNCIDILWHDDGRPAFAVGMMSTAIEVLSSAPVRTVAVRFRPGAAGLFLAAPLHVLTDGRADLDQLWSRDVTTRLGDRLWDGELNDHQRLELIEQQLLLRLQAADGDAQGAGARLVRLALHTLDASDGNVRIEALAAALRVSRQHLAGQFRERVGLSPKLYARICRFRRATAALKHGLPPDWAQLALECGYFDQSHLIHDFQEFAHCAPERL